jgi:hypothetical protein
MSARYCPTCGAPIGDPKRFCPECGAALPDQPDTTVATARLGKPDPEGAPARRGERGLLWITLGGIGCLGALMLIACAGLLLFSFRGGLLAAPRSPTSSPAITAAPSATALAPSPVSDSGVLLFDDFSDAPRSTLTEEEDDTSRSSFDAGMFVIEVKKAETLTWALADGLYDDVVIQADSTIAAGSKAVAAGLIFHYQDNRNFYLFSVSSDGYYALEVLQNNEWQTLIDWTPSESISATHNTLRVEIKGGKIAMLVNGDLLEATQDTTLSGGGAGLAVSSFDAGQVTTRFDNLLITRNP